MKPVHELEAMFAPGSGESLLSLIPLLCMLAPQCDQYSAWMTGLGKTSPPVSHEALTITTLLQSRCDSTSPVGVECITAVASFYAV